MKSSIELSLINKFEYHNNHQHPIRLSNKIVRPFHLSNWPKIIPSATICIKVRHNYLCGHYGEKLTPCSRPGGCTKLSCHMYKDADSVDLAENYCNPCLKDWKYKDLQAQTDVVKAAKNQREKATKQKKNDDAKAKKQKEKGAKSKRKAMRARKAKQAKNNATDSTKRGSGRPRAVMIRMVRHRREYTLRWLGQSNRCVGQTA